MLRIGTRGSPLALAQANMVAARLSAATGQNIANFPLAIIKTTGDATQDRPLSDIGGKGLFTKEIDQAQLDGAVDVAVHSSKDLPTELPEGLSVLGYLPREDARDAFIGRNRQKLGDLPPGAVIGTVSLRRQALVRALRPDLKIVLLRGNVGTRLRKVADGEVDGTLLAVAGLKRLGLAGAITEILETEQFLPAVGQGAIGIVTRTSDQTTNDIVRAICDPDTAYAVTAERAMLKALDGSCRTPIAGYARLVGGSLHLKGLVMTPDGSDVRQGHIDGPADMAEALGLALGSDLKRQMPASMIARLQG